MLQKHFWLKVFSPIDFYYTKLLKKQITNLSDNSFGKKDYFFSKVKRGFDNNKYLYYGLFAVALAILITVFSVA